MVRLRKRHQGGYVGLIALLVAVVLISLFMVTALRSSLGPIREASGTSTSTEQNAIQAAENVKKLLESRNKF